MAVNFKLGNSFVSTDDNNVLASAILLYPARQLLNNLKLTHYFQLKSTTPQQTLAKNSRKDVRCN